MAITFDQYAPFDEGPGANTMEDGWRSIHKPAGMPGVIRDSLNGFSVYADSTGMQVKVRTGEVLADGIWGKTTSEKILSIATAATIPGGQSRKDLVIWRLDSVNNRFELDVTTGSPGTAPVEPAIVRNTSVVEGPLATVTVSSNAVVTIAAADVLDSRWFGGPTVPTLVDDFAMLGDKISTTTRANITNFQTYVDGRTTLTLTQAQRDITATMIRYYLKTARAGGFRDLRVYTGYSRHRLYDVTGNILPNDTGTADRINSDALPAPLSLKAGQYVGFAHLTTGPGLTTSPQFGTGTGVTSVEILNPSTTALDPLGRWTTVFKTGQTTLPSVIQVHVDGNWSKALVSTWYALA